jgi:hypothetical protein
MEVSSHALEQKRCRHTGAPAAAIKRPVGPADELARSKLRRSIYALLAAISVGAMIGRILAACEISMSDFGFWC